MKHGERAYLSMHKIKALVRCCFAHFRMTMTWFTLKISLIQMIEEKVMRRTQVCYTNSRRKIEQLPPTMHRDPGTLAFHDNVFCKVIQALCDMTLRKVEKRCG
jgi:hypothetical protein